MADRRLYLGTVTDSRRWDLVALRDGDVIVVTPPKCGTTWMQTIVSLLLSGDPEVEPELSVKMPWVDFVMRDAAEMAERLEAMDHRRGLKSHTPLDGLPLHEGARYVCVFRHPLDAHLSFRKHARNLPMTVFDPWYPEEDTDGTAFRRFLAGAPDGPDGDALSLAHVLRHYEAARALAGRPNVSLFHFADMKRDLAGAFERLARLIGTPHPAPLMERLAKAATFGHMKANAARYAPSGGKGFMKSDEGFFPGGAVGGWHGALTAEEVAAYDAVMDARLTPAERDWLENGSGPEGRAPGT